MRGKFSKTICLLVLLYGCLAQPANADESQLMLAPLSSVVDGNAPATSGSPGPLAGGSVKTVLSSLAIVLGAFVLLTALLKKQETRSSGTSSDILKSLGTVQVAPQTKLHLVRFGQRLLVLHVSVNTVQKVAEISDPEEVHQLLGDAGTHSELDTLGRPATELPLDTSTAVNVSELLRSVEDRNLFTERIA